ncbi:hypothetical protein PoB_006044800 [Plakobranchus ocellatus]|uniref:Uncharacterized protein n=1 Tax=Plakobranchus ocellatus TaxID=259542 RepID=A0AAV4CPX3_9GAST|nr:hypothetical protein PoB_006044800 [Plakobranchus ocellatus]
MQIKVIPEKRMENFTCRASSSKQVTSAQGLERKLNFLVISFSQIVLPLYQYGYHADSDIVDIELSAAGRSEGHWRYAQFYFQPHICISSVLALVLVSSLYLPCSLTEPVYALRSFDPVRSRSAQRREPNQVDDDDDGDEDDDDDEDDEDDDEDEDDDDEDDDEDDDDEDDDYDKGVTR